MAQLRPTILNVVLAVSSLSFFGFGLGLVLDPAVAQAKPRGDGGDPYDAARDAEARLDYRGVVNHATKALEMANSHERLVNLYRLLGTANGVLGKTEDAVDAFTRLLAV